MEFKSQFIRGAAAVLLAWGAAGVVDAASADENSLAGSYLAGQFARNNGGIDDGITALRRVHQSDPGNLDVTSQLQGMLLLKGDVEQAVAMAAEIHKRDNKDQLSDLLLALREVRNNNPEGAAGMLDPAFENGNAQLWLPLISAWVDLSRGKLDKPLTLAALSADVGRAAPLVNYHLALINAQAGFVDAAAQNFKSAVPDPRNPPSRVMKALLQFYKQNNQPQVLAPVVEAYHAAHGDEGDNTPGPVIANTFDGIAEVLYTMGGVMLGAEANNDAALYLQLALYVKPDFDDAMLALGNAYAELQQFERSNDAYARISKESPLYEQAQLYIVVNYDRMNKLNDAFALLDAMARQAPNNPDALVTKGDLLRVHARYREAADAYTAALARVHSQQQNKYWPVWFARGTCFERMGNWKAAESDLEQALALKPDQPDVLNYLGYGWMERSEKLADARAMIEKAVKARPDDAEIVDSMGWALYLSGDYDKATEYLEKAVELLPADATVNDHLGDAYWRLGHKTEARYQWERSLNSSPDAKEADTLRRKLKEGLPPSTLAGTVPADADGKPVNAATP